MVMRALGTIIEWDSERPLGETEFYSGLLDYSDTRGDCSIRGRTGVFDGSPGNSG
jgi:hypothetical protein